MMQKKGLIPALSSVIAGDLKVRRNYSKMKKTVRKSATLRPHARTILPLLRRYYIEHQWLYRSQEVRSLKRSWRFLHRWLAILMLLVITFHIVMAFYYAELWIVNGS